MANTRNSSYYQGSEQGKLGKKTQAERHLEESLEQMKLESGKIGQLGTSIRPDAT